MESFYPIDQWIKWNDVIRCPYTFKDPRWSDWARIDDERLLIIALDRYADYLKKVKVT